MPWEAAGCLNWSFFHMKPKLQAPDKRAAILEAHRITLYSIFSFRGPQPPGSNAWWSEVRADEIIIEINFMINVMHLNHPNSPPPHPWQNCLLQNRSLVLKNCGWLFLHIHSLCLVIYLSPAKPIYRFQVPVALFNQGDGIIFSLTPGVMMELEPRNEVWTGWPTPCVNRNFESNSTVLPSLFPRATCPIYGFPFQL